MENKQIEINDFTLSYDGIYRITFSNGKGVKAYLTLDVILKMIEIEGYSIDDVANIIKEWKPLEFKKVTLIAKCSEDEDGKRSFITSESAEDLYMEYKISLIDFSVKE